LPSCLQNTTIISRSNPFTPAFTQGNCYATLSSKTGD
jgi:hypothetical protein